MKRNNKKGFTIVELVIVIAVIAILAGVMIPTFGSVIADAKGSAAIQAGRSYYTEVTTADILDDGVYNATAPATLPTDVTYTCADGKIASFTYKHNNGYTATLNVATGEWSAAK